MQIEIFNLVLDFNPLMIAAQTGFWASMWYLFSHGGWILFAYVIIVQGYFIWQQEQQRKWFSTHKFILLAIDIPKDTEQTPKAVEQLFATLSGAHVGELTLYEEYVQGIFQLSFSFEIVSIDGYVQFLIRTPSQFRNLVESSIYSQYPDAEITEVDDYTTDIPIKYPNDQYKMWGTEIKLSASDVYPIKTYPFFEDRVSQEFKDPMASILETMSRIQVGEQVWLQINIQPTGFDWPKRSQEEALRIAGKKKALSEMKKTSRSNKLVDWTTDKIERTSEGLYPLWKDIAPAKDELPSLMLHLTPGERAKIEAIEMKASKVAFMCKIRLIYLSPPEQYAPNRVVSSVFGSIKQFIAMDLNGFKPDKRTRTTTHYFFTKYRSYLRRKKLMLGYKFRSTALGHKKFLLNIEELASIWHFPSKYVIAPNVKRTTAKKMAGPTSLPIQETETGQTSADDLKNQLQDTGFNVNLDNDYFENKFAKNKSTIQAVRKKGSPPTNLPTD